MRAIIDSGHLPTAVRYYTNVRKEPAQSPQNDITIDNLEPLPNLTLELLLNSLERYATAGEKEFLLVLHSNPDGLLLPIGTGALANFNAHRSVLDLIKLASEAFGNLDDTKNPDIAVNNAFLSAWTDFFSRTPTVNTAPIAQASDIAAKCVEAAKLGQLWVNNVCRTLHINERRLRELAELRDRVSQADIDRLEFRSCRLGGGRGLKEVASFFGATSYAPTVRTFYVHQPVQIVTNQANLNRIRGLGQASRRFTASNGAAGARDDVAFAIGLTRSTDATYVSRMLAISDRAAWNWYTSFIWSAMPFQGRGADVVVAGFWTPDSTKPFVFPQEPEYRNLIEGEF